MINEVFLLFGSNIGERINNIEEAVKKLAAEGCSLINTSPVYESSAWGFECEDDFLNMAALFTTVLKPTELLKIIQSTENAMGRKSDEKAYASRIIDIDILFFGNLVINLDNLIIPHPLIAERNFVLLPLNDICPALIHPLKEISISEMLRQCNDKNKVWLWKR